MGLKLRIKPEHTVRIGQATVKNVGARACELLITGNEKIERDDRYAAPKLEIDLGQK